MEWNGRRDGLRPITAQPQFNWDEFHFTPLIHSLQLIVCCAPLGGGPRAPFTNSIDSLFVLLHWFINSSIPQRQITQVNWFVHFTLILASLISFVFLSALSSFLASCRAAAAAHNPPINSFQLPKEKQTNQFSPPRNHQTNQIHFISLNCLIGLLHRQPLVFIVGSLPWASGPSHNLPQFNFTGWLSSL